MKRGGRGRGEEEKMGREGRGEEEGKRGEKGWKRRGGGEENVLVSEAYILQGGFL